MLLKYHMEITALYSLLEILWILEIIVAEISQHEEFGLLMLFVV